MNRSTLAPCPGSPYERFVQSESTNRARDYCYATTRDEHAAIFRKKTLLDLKSWRLNCRRMLQTHIDNKEHLSPDYAEKCENLATRIELLDEEIDRRSTVLLPPGKEKAVASIWNSRLNEMDEREKKRQRVEPTNNDTGVRPVPFRPTILGYEPPAAPPAFTFNCEEGLEEEEKDQ